MWSCISAPSEPFVQPGAHVLTCGDYACPFLCLCKTVKTNLSTCPASVYSPITPIWYHMIIQGFGNWTKTLEFSVVTHVRRGVAVQQGKWGLESEQVLSSTSLLCCLHFLRFFTGLALLQQEQKASEDTEKEAALFLQQGLERFISQRCSKRFVCVLEVDVGAFSGSVRARQFQ